MFYLSSKIYCNLLNINFKICWNIRFYLLKLFPNTSCCIHIIYLEIVYIVHKNRHALQINIDWKTDYCLRNLWDTYFTIHIYTTIHLHIKIKIINRRKTTVQFENWKLWIISFKGVIETNRSLLKGLVLSSVKD